jgi:hypothetical protein
MNKLSKRAYLRSITKSNYYIDRVLPLTTDLIDNCAIRKIFKTICYDVEAFVIFDFRNHMKFNRNHPHISNYGVIQSTQTFDEDLCSRKHISQNYMIA